MADGLGPEGGLRTERLLLRPPEPDDAAAIHRLVNEWGIVRNLTRLAFPYPRTLADEWIAAIARQRRRGHAFHFALIADGAGKGGEAALVGCVGLRLDASPRIGELGYWIGRPHWRRGYAREALARITSWAMANLDIDRLEASVAIDNLASSALLEGLGFRKFGSGTQMFEARGSEQLVHRYAAAHDEVSRRLAAAPSAASDTAPAPAESVAHRRILLVAAAALIDEEGKVLLARRPEGKRLAGLWEFPGGKIEPGETPEQALARELREELGVELGRGCAAPFGFASHPYDEFHLLMPLYLCRRWGGTARAREGQTLAWVAPQRLADYPMTPAGRPLVPLLKAFL